jgi:hypothetical protein
MNLIVKSAILVAAVALCVPQSSDRAVADTIHWTLHNGAFDDGGVVAGGFDWDTNLHRATSWDFSVSGGNTSTFPATTYTDGASRFGIFLNFPAGTDTLIFAIDSATPNRRDLRFSFANLALDSAVAVLPLDGGSIFTGSTGYVECFNCSPRERIGVAGAFFSGDAVTVPSPIAGAGVPGLILASGGLLGWWRRRKAAT